MDNLLFTALIIALLYYFFNYLPRQKYLETQPLKQTVSTQTEPFTTQDEKLLASSIDEILKQIKQLNHQLK